jgi:hypothetical protein
MPVRLARKHIRIFFVYNSRPSRKKLVAFGVVHQFEPSPVAAIYERQIRWKRGSMTRSNSREDCRFDEAKVLKITDPVCDRTKACGGLSRRWLDLMDLAAGHRPAVRQEMCPKNCAHPHCVIGHF